MPLGPARRGLAEDCDLGLCAEEVGDVGDAETVEADEAHGRRVVPRVEAGDLESDLGVGRVGEVQDLGDASEATSGRMQGEREDRRDVVAGQTGNSVQVVPAHVTPPRRG